MARAVAAASAAAAAAAGARVLLIRPAAVTRQNDAVASEQHPAVSERRIRRLSDVSYASFDVQNDDSYGGQGRVAA